MWEGPYSPSSCWQVCGLLHRCFVGDPAFCLHFTASHHRPSPWHVRHRSLLVSRTHSPPLAGVPQDRPCGLGKPAAHTERRGGTNLCHRACQSYREFCKKQLPADPATTSSPPPVCPEPLDPTGGRVGPPPARASKRCLQGGMLAAGERGWALRDIAVSLGLEQPQKGEALGIGACCSSQKSADLLPGFWERQRGASKKPQYSHSSCVPLSLLLNSQGGDVPGQRCPRSWRHRWAQSTVAFRASAWYINSTSSIKQHIRASLSLSLQGTGKLLERMENVYACSGLQVSVGLDEG